MKSSPLRLPISKSKIQAPGSVLNLNKSQVKFLEKADIQKDKIEVFTLYLVIQFLYIRENLLREVKGFGNLPLLKVLDLSQNQIHTLQFNALPCLKVNFVSRR